MRAEIAIAVIEGRVDRDALEVLADVYCARADAYEWQVEGKGGGK